ncbi:hypothetical protein G7054_g4041 [Neopestalotiopsis clavispora]|nr:hypothetical protein G7054_g4041 [Neopestalotiopsis clavispora]
MPEPSLAGKTFIVTAAAAGIGFATTKLLLDSGANVGMSDKDGEALKLAMARFDPEIIRRVLTGVVDVSSRVAVRSFIYETRTHFNGLDGFASVAGVSGRKFGAQNVWDIPEDEYDYIMDVNLRGLFNILAESMRPGVMNRPGAIVAVGSEYSFRGSKGCSLYAASKHGLLGMVKSVAQEAGAGPDGIRVNAVLPGPTDTPARRAVMEMVGKERDSTKRRPLGRPADPEELAEIILFLLSQKSSVVTGAAWTADGGAPL